MLRTFMFITQFYCGATETADQTVLRPLLYVPHNMKGKVKKKNTVNRGLVLSRTKVLTHFDLSLDLLRL